MNITTLYKLNLTKKKKLKWKVKVVKILQNNLTSEEVSILKNVYIIPLYFAELNMRKFIWWMNIWDPVAKCFHFGRKGTTVQKLGRQLFSKCALPQTRKRVGAYSRGRLIKGGRLFERRVVGFIKAFTVNAIPVSRARIRAFWKSDSTVSS